VSRRNHFFKADLAALPFAKYELERDGQDRSEPENRSRISLGTA